MQSNQINYPIGTAPQQPAQQQLQPMALNIDYWRGLDSHMNQFAQTMNIQGNSSNIKQRLEQRAKAYSNDSQDKTMSNAKILKAQRLRQEKQNARIEKLRLRNEMLSTNAKLEAEEEKQEKELALQKLHAKLFRAENLRNQQLNRVKHIAKLSY